MPLRLIMMSLPLVVQTIAGTVEIPGVEVGEDGMPPRWMLEEAHAALTADKTPIWHTPWLYVMGDPPRVVGSATFKGAPVNGRVEIGYGVANAYHGQGVGTAGARAMVALAFDQAEVTEVYAESEVTNHASKRVLQKVGFIHTGQRESAEDGLVDCWVIGKTEFDAGQHNGGTR